MPFLIDIVQSSRISEDPDTACTETTYQRDVNGNARTPINTAIGAIIVFTVTINATGGDTFADKELLFTPRMFAPPNVVTLPTQPVGWALETGANLPALNIVAWTGENVIRANREFAYTFPSPTQLICVWEFHVTSDFVDWPSQPYSTQNRLLSTLNQGLFLADGGTSAYNDATLQSEIQFVLRIREAGTTDAYQYATFKDAINNEKRVFRVNVQPKWYGRNAGSTDWAWRINELRNTVAGNIVAQTFYSALPYESLYDDNFDIQSDEITAFDDNVIEFFINGSTAPTAMGEVQIFLLKQSNIDPNLPFKDAYEYIETGFYANGAHVLADGALSGAATVSLSTTSGYVQITVDGTQLEYGQTYRFGLVMYNTSTCESWSVISTSYRATMLPACEPDAVLTLGNYCGQGAGKYGLFSYHERISTGVQFDLTNFFSCMFQAGITVTLDDLQYVSLLIGTSVITEFPTGNLANAFSASFDGTTLNTIIDNVENGMFAIAGNVIDASAVIRLSEQFDTVPNSPLIGSFLPLAWVIEFDVTTPDGQVCRIRYNAYQQIGINDWENDNATPNLDIQVFNGDDWPTRKAVRSLCQVDKLIFELKKLNDLAGVDVLLQANYYPETSPTGNTVLSGILENDAGAPDVSSIVPQQNELPIFDVTPWTGDTATFCLLVDDLPINQQIYVDAVVCEPPAVSCCPVIDPMPVGGYWIRRAGNNVYIFALSAQFNNAIFAGGGTGNVINTHNVSNPNTGDQTGIVSIQQNAGVHYVIINALSSGLTSAKWDLDITANFDCDGGPRAILHTHDVNILFPLANQGWQFNTTRPAATTCIDLTV